MTASSDLMARVAAAQAADQVSASDFLGVNGLGRQEILDAFDQLADLGIQKHDNLVFEQSDSNAIDVLRPTRLIIGASTFLGVKGLRPATAEEIEKRIIVRLNADALTSDQFQTVVTDFATFLTGEAFSVQTTLASDRADMKVDWT